ncbi:Solute carrier family 46 member 3 [Armadillidium nasatum]|uniref:Solute carrier family 46 member 3 n=1 Tax=Armadillidium nasatum TaxID=96803 RepID=A0A5N5SMA4_9CRUS|nr:Solute carrier family 46 member 3 [Armadillidium nasatum]
MMVCYSYITDISSDDSRTTRIAFLDVMFMAGPPMAYFLSDILFKTVGYTGVYSISSVMLLFCIIYTIFILKETRGPFASEESLPESIENSKKYSTFFNVEHFKETLNIIVKRRQNRNTILLLMILICLMNFRSGIMGIDYLFTKIKFSWNYSEFTHWSIVYYISMAAGESLILPFLSSFLHLGEYILGTLGSISRIACCAVQGFSSSSLDFYIAAGVSCIAEIPLSVVRSKISKLSFSDDIGKTFSMLASWESIVPALSYPLYTLVYNTTIKVFPGAVFFITVVIFFICGTSLFILFLKENFEVNEDYNSETGCLLPKK